MPSITVVLETRLEIFQVCGCTRGWVARRSTNTNRAIRIAATPRPIAVWTEAQPWDSTAGQHEHQGGERADPDDGPGDVELRPGWRVPSGPSR